MNTEDFVTYEQAIALKELGFKEECFYHYDYNNQDDVVPNTDISHLAISANDFKISYNELGFFNEICYDAPTLSQVQKWLRNKGYSVEVTSFYQTWISSITKLDDFETIELNGNFSSYEEALSEGITECFKYLEK